MAVESRGSSPGKPSGSTRTPGGSTDTSGGSGQEAQASADQGGARTRCTIRPHQHFRRPTTAAQEVDGLTGLFSGAVPDDGPALENGAAPGGGPPALDSGQGLEAGRAPRPITSRHLADSPGAFPRQGGAGNAGNLREFRGRTGPDAEACKRLRRG